MNNVYPARWLAIKLLESDPDILAQVAGNQALLEATAAGCRANDG